MNKLDYFSHNWLGMKINNESLNRFLLRVRGTVYDLGAGTRPYEEDILQRAVEYVAVDWNNTLHGSHADISADLNKPLPISNCVADTVVSFQVLEHLCEPQVMLGEAHRILKPGGGILITVPFQWWIHEAPYDYYRYTRHGLDYLLTKAGFVNVEIIETTGFWTMWFLKFNYQTAKLVRGPLLLRYLIKTFFLPFWFINQVVAPLLDRGWAAPQETAGYAVSAIKP